MKLLMLGWELPPYNSGGLGVACFQMAKALSGRGVDIKFVLPYSAKHPESEKFMEILPAVDIPPMIDEKGDYVAMGAYSGTCYVCRSRKCVHAKKYGTGFVEATKRYADHVGHMILKKKLHPEIIHAHDWLSIEAGIRAKNLTGAPLVVHVHATEFDRSGGVFGNPLIHEIEYHGLQLADKIFAVSKITKDIIVREYNIPPGKVEVVHNSIDPAELERVTFHTDNYLYLRKMRENGYKIILNIGRLTVQKGLSYLVEAAARAMSRNPKLLLVISGSGEDRERLIEQAADLGISDRVIFPGWVRGIKFRELYELADIFVMPSVSEPFGLTALEAAHYDTAILLSKTSGAGEVLNHVLRFDYWDTQKLADELINISLSPALERELKENVRREYLKISWGDIAEKMIKEYDKIISRKPTRKEKIYV